MAHVVSRVKGDELCPYHLDKKLEFMCTDDNELVCSLCMVENHSRHAIKQLRHVADEKSQKIREKISQRENEVLPDLHRLIQSADRMILQKYKSSGEMVSNIIEHGNALKMYIDRRMKDDEASVKKDRDMYAKIMNSYKKELVKRREQIITENVDFESVMKTGSNVMIVDVEADMTEVDLFPATPNVKDSTLSFVKANNSQFILDKAFGSLNCTQAGQSSGTSAPIVIQRTNSTECVTESTSTVKERINSWNTATVTVDRKPSLIHETQDDSNIHEQQTEQMPSRVLAEKNIKLITKFEVSPDIIRRMVNGDSWVCSKGGNLLYLVKSSGIVKQILKIDRTLNDIYCHPITSDLYCCAQYKTILHDKSVRKINIANGKTETIFKLKTEPLCVSITEDGNFIGGVVVANKAALFIYSAEGKMVMTKSLEMNAEPSSIVINDENSFCAVSVSPSVVIVDMALNRLREFDLSVCNPLEVGLTMIKSVCFGPNGLLHCVYNKNSLGHVATWNADGGHLVRKYTSSSLLNGCDVKPDGLVWIGRNDTELVSINDVEL